MFPLEEGCIYPRNQWYVGALAGEVNRSLLERKILNEPVVFYRTEQGAATAIAGLCPHRLYPMVLGKLVGDDVECGYHGIRFGCDGACTRIPSQDSIPKAFKIRTYPTHEMGGVVWIWMGDPELADTAKISNAYCLPGWDTTYVDTCHVKARYTLLIDNLMDLSHIAYLHATAIPGDAFIKYPISIEQHGEALRAVRKVRNEPYGGYETVLFGPGSGEVDFDAPTDYYGPSLILSGSIHMANGRHLGALRYLHMLTPETPTTTHYFGGFTRDFRQGDEQLTAVIRKFDHVVRQQDVEGLAAVEPNLAQHADAKRELSVIADSAGIRVRRMLSAQINAETQRDRSLASEAVL